MNSTDHRNPRTNQPAARPGGGRRLLITAGPTHEPIDAVRYIGNRSSGRLGIALAERAAARGLDVTLLLGPTNLPPPIAPRPPLSPSADSHLRTARFRTTADLELLLAEHWPKADVLVMAAAVADYRPKPLVGRADAAEGKLKRTSENLTLELEPTPDLLAACGHTRSTGQMLVGFALEPRSRMLESAAGKLTRKGLDLIVANPLETMDAPMIEATLLSAQGVVGQTDGPISKEIFADWLLDAIERHLSTTTPTGAHRA